MNRGRSGPCFDQPPTCRQKHTQHSTFSWIGGEERERERESERAREGEGERGREREEGRGRKGGGREEGGESTTELVVSGFSSAHACLKMLERVTC